MIWYYVREEDGLVWYALSGKLVTDPILAACISDNPSLWHAKVVIDVAWKV